MKSRFFLALVVVWLSASAGVCLAASQSSSKQVLMIAQKDTGKNKKVDKVNKKNQQKNKAASTKAGNKPKPQPTKKVAVNKNKPPVEESSSRLPVYFAVFAALLGTGAVLGAAYFTNPPPGTDKMPERSSDDQFDIKNMFNAA